MVILYLYHPQFFGYHCTSWAYRAYRTPSLSFRETISLEEFDIWKLATSWIYIVGKPQAISE